MKADVTFWFKNTGSFFRRNGVTEKINPYKQTGIAKELDIDILDGKGYFSGRKPSISFPGANLAAGKQFSNTIRHGNGDICR